MTVGAPGQNRNPSPMRASAKVGVTGHQQREGLDWVWVREQIRDVLSSAGPFIEALTSLAVGTDQVFAEEAIRLKVSLTAVIPFAGYERCFDGAGLTAYRGLLAASQQHKVLDTAGDEQQSFLAAGIFVAEQSDLLLAVWDGKPAQGLGGTADIVRHALVIGRTVVHLDPFTRAKRRLQPSPAHRS